MDKHTNIAISAHNGTLQLGELTFSPSSSMQTLWQYNRHGLKVIDRGHNRYLAISDAELTWAGIALKYQITCCPLDHIFGINITLKKNDPDICSRFLKDMNIKTGEYDWGWIAVQEKDEIHPYIDPEIKLVYKQSKGDTSCPQSYI